MSATVSHRACRSCGARFEARASYHVLCLDCWRIGNDDRLRKEGWDNGYAAGYRQGLADAKKIAPRPAPAPAPPLDGEFILDIIKLTHPDRHPVERQELANRVTAALLQMRR